MPCMCVYVCSRFGASRVFHGAIFVVSLFLSVVSAPGMQVKRPRRHLKAIPSPCRLFFLFLAALIVDSYAQNLNPLVFLSHLSCERVTPSCAYHCTFSALQSSALPWLLGQCLGSYIALSLGEKPVPAPPPKVHVLVCAPLLHVCT